jgi:biotin carboxyl carrier protein
MKVWVTLDGRSAEVNFSTEGGLVVLDFEGRKLHADFVRLPDGEVYSLLVEGRSYEVRVSPDKDALDVTWQSRMIPVEVKHPLEKLLQAQQGAAAKSRGEIITAPMPGAVVSIRVKEGDTVAPGQSVLVLEAMKMQNELTSHAGGVVTEIHVAEKAAVSAGAKLITLKPVEAAS